MSKFLDKTGLDTLWAKIKSTFQTLGNLVTAWGSTPSDTKYPSEKLVKTSLDAKANDSDVVHKTGTETVSGAKTFSNTSSVFDGKCANDINGNPLSSSYGVFRTELGNPTLEERGIIEETFANQLECLPKDKIVYETSPKGTETWTTLDVTDNTHNLLWGGNVLGSINISKNVDFRITVNAPYYCWLNFLYFYGGGQGATFHIKLERKLNSSGAWSVVSDTAETAIGWPGHNTIRHSNIAFSTSSSQYGSVRLTLYIVSTGNIESYPTYYIGKFRYYGGYPYKSDPWIVKNGSSGVTNFPKGITSGVAIPVSSGGTGKTTAKAAEYNLTTGKSEISDTTSGDDRVVFELASPSESNGVTRGFRKLSTIWTWIKGLLSSESDVNISGNAATATKATQDSDGNAINATYFKSSGNTTLVAGAATKIGTQNGADVKLTLPAHQDISGKMNTSASNATAPSSSGGDGATATLLNNLTDGNSDIVTTDDGDNVLIATTDNGGTVTNKWYKRKLVKLIPWIIQKLGTRLVYDCGAGSSSGDDFDAALAAFNAGQWVIIHDSANVYYCAGTYNSGLRFKRLTNSASGISVNTLNWTRGSSPSAGSQLDASLSGHTHSQYLTASSITGKMNTNADNAASGALQHLTAQLTEGTSDFTDNTEIFTSYAGNNGFAESGHANQPYRRKASSMLNYVANSGLAQLVQIYGNSAKKLEIGYATIADTGNSSEMKALVELTCVSQSSTSQPGSSILMLVSVSCSNTYRFAKATILENTFWDGRTRPVIVTKVVSNRMYVYVGLLANNGTSLVSFDYTYAKITRIGHVNNWSWEHEYTSDGTFDYIFYCDDSVKFVPTVNSNTIGTTAGISNNSPADACVTYWSAMQPGCIRIVYNQNGTEYTLLFSKSSDGKYGSILKWSYTDNYMRIIRIQNNSVLTGADWVKISAGYADSAGSLSSSVSVGSANQPVYFNNGVPTACNWWVS